MNDNPVAPEARKEKICLEEGCVESWEGMPAEVKHHCVEFVYCPFCANEMVTRCSACGETVADTNFTFCPWCGGQFEE